MTSGFLSGAQQDLADEGLWRLGDEHGDDAGYVGRLNLAWVIGLTAAETGVDRAGGYD